MPCFYPIQAYKNPVYHHKTKKIISYQIDFEERKGDAGMALRLPCGQCDGCRLERARQWSVRCMHEATMHEQNCFITLTYNDEHLPMYNSLDYSDFQNFMKRLRKRYCYHLPSKFHHGPFRKIRFFMCGEYGDGNGRAHFHACLFGIDFNDRVYLKTSESGHPVFTSEELASLWIDKGGDSLGFSSVGDVNFDSAGYVARYVLKKATRGSVHDLLYKMVDVETGEIIDREREFTHMSLKPGIGQPFYQKWKGDIFPHNYVVVNGKKTEVPKYYKKLLATENKELYDSLQEEACIKSIEKAGDNHEQRLRAKEMVVKAQIKYLKRQL